MFTPRTDSFLVSNLPTGRQNSQEISGLENGGFTITWGDFVGQAQIYTRIFTAGGAPSIDQTRVSSDVAGSQNRPDVLALSNNETINVYTLIPPGEIGANIYLQRFDARGQTDGIEIRVNDDLDISAFNPQITQLAGGRFAVSFDSLPGGSGIDVYGQVLDSSGNRIGNSFRVNDTTSSFQSQSEIIALENGGFAVAWRSRDVDGSLYAVMVKFYDTDGVEQTSEIRVNQHSRGSQTLPSITSLPNGNIVIVWSSDGQDGNAEGIYARIYDQSGTALGNEFLVNTRTQDAQYSPDIVSLPNGQFIVVWIDNYSDTLTSIIVGQHYDVDGTRIGGEFIISDDFTNNDVFPEIAALSDGAFVVTWRQLDLDDSTTNVYARVFQTVSSATSNADTLNGNQTDDTLDGLEGNDTLFGYDGNDRLIGGTGNDTLNGGDGADTLNGGDGDDFIFGGDTSADLRDLVYAGAGNDTIDGGYGNDLIFGQDGDDNIIGGFGSDTLNGQDGNDVITGSALSDLVSGNAGDDFVNGGFGHDRINGGAGADRFFHLGIFDHGSDWIQDYNSSEGDLLLFGNSSAARADFQINYAHTATDAGERSGDDNVAEAFVIYRPTGQIMWALVDGQGQREINLQIGSDTFDLLA